MIYQKTNLGPETHLPRILSRQGTRKEVHLNQLGRWASQRRSNFNGKWETEFPNPHVLTKAFKKM